LFWPRNFVGAIRLDEWNGTTWLADTKRTLGSKPRGSEFVDWKSTLFPSIRLYRHPGETGVNPNPSSTWIPFSSGMTDAVRHLGAGVRRHDELSLPLKARDFNIPERDIKLLSVILTMLNKR